jgi:hypothetical protein
MLRSLAIGLAATTLAIAPALAQRDGTPGNPPSTAVQRGLDRATGAAPTPADGTPGNPPGTAAGRAVDKATGSNISGANPSHSTPASRERAREGKHTGQHKDMNGSTTTR